MVAVFLFPMRVGLILLCVLCSLCEGLPFGKLDSVTPTVNGFMKIAYSQIEEADVKSLAVSMLEPYRVLCTKYGAWTVSQELRKIFEGHNVDLKISMARLNKLGSLLRRLEAEVDEDDDDDEAGRGHKDASFTELRRGEDFRF